MKFSIIVPIYNSGRYLRECLNSIRAQTFTDWECICIDDGSKDESGGIIDQYVSMDTRFVSVHKKNEGVGEARNTGLDMVRGEWIAYLDSDDWFSKDFLGTAAEIIEKYPQVEMVNLGLSMFKGSEVRLMPLVSHETYLDTSKELPSRTFNTGFFQTVYLRSALGGIRFRHYSIGEDRVYALACLKRVRYIAESPTIAYNYRLSPNSAMRSKMTLRKKWHRFLSSVWVAVLVVGLKSSIRVKLRYIRPVFSNLWSLFWGEI